MEGCSEFLSAAGIHAAIQKNTRDRVKKEALERKRSVLYLIYAYLREHNLNTTAESLVLEAQLTNDIEVCDNIDLDTILQEYQSYYFAKFSKNAKITKVVKNNSVRITSPPTKETGNKRRSALTVPSAPVNKAQDSPATREVPVRDFQIEIRKLFNKAEEQVVEQVAAIAPLSGNNQKSLCDFEGYSSEWREMAEIILKEIVPSNLGVTWKDCVGLAKSAALLKEAVVYPLTYPNFFSGLITPWKGILMYGPPGTGKTLLSKAVACESKTTFFNVTSSCFINKWRGESEKMIKVLFDIARFYAPSTIFIDELDALACSHSDLQHDASRRFKSELLIQLDGILKDDDRVFVLATTNKPWDLDTAILRRFEKRILVDLPNEQARTQIFKYYFSLNGNAFSQNEYTAMAKICLDFSGSDIKTTCKEACMRKLREGLLKIENREVKAENLQMGLPNIADVLEAAKGIRPVTNSTLQEKYWKWHEEFGCH